MRGARFAICPVRIRYGREAEATALLLLLQAATCQNNIVGCALVLCVQWPLDKALYLAASAESGSEHPLARALLAYAAQRLEGGSVAVAAALLEGDRQQGEEGMAVADGGSVPGSPEAERPADAGLQAPLLATQAAPALRDHSAAAQQEATAQQLRRSGGLAAITASEALPGRGLKAWLACPAERLHGLPPALLGSSGAAPVRTRSAAAIATAAAGSQLRGPGTPHASEGKRGSSSREGYGSQTRMDRLSGIGGGSASSSGIARASSSPAPAATDPAREVQVRLVIGNRQLMQEEGVALTPQVSLGCCCADVASAAAGGAAAGLAVG